MPKKAAVLFVVCLSVIVMSGCSFFSDSQAKKVLNEGIALFNNGDCENAKLKFAEAVQKDPNLWQGYYYMAECDLKKMDFQESLKLAQKAMALSGKDKNSSDTLKTFFLTGGQSALAKEDYNNAISFLSEAVSLDQNATDSHFLLGKALLERGEKGDMKTAIGEFKAAIAKSKDTAQDTEQIRRILFERAKKYSLKGDIYTESRCYLVYTENFDQNDVAALVLIGKLFLKMGNPIGALYYAEKAYKLNPKDKGAWELMDTLNTPFSG
jgi:tetratricopeptide (TPR) repeat protein